MKFKVGDRVRYKEEYLYLRPSQDKDSINEYIILAVDKSGCGYVYRKDNERGIRGGDYKDFTWVILEHQVEPIENLSTGTATCIWWSQHGSSDSNFEDYKLKENNMNITKFAKELLLSSDEKLMRKYGLKTECGDYTAEAREIILNKLCKDNEAELIDIAKKMNEEDK